MGRYCHRNKVAIWHQWKKKNSPCWLVTAPTHPPSYSIIIIKPPNNSYKIYKSIYQNTNTSHNMVQKNIYMTNKWTWKYQIHVSAKKLNLKILCNKIIRLVKLLQMNYDKAWHFQFFFSSAPVSRKTKPLEWGNYFA